MLLEISIFPHISFPEVLFSSIQSLTQPSFTINYFSEFQFAFHLNQQFPFSFSTSISSLIFNYSCVFFKKKKNLLALCLWKIVVTRHNFLFLPNCLVKRKKVSHDITHLTLFALFHKINFPMFLNQTANHHYQNKNSNEFIPSGSLILRIELFVIYFAGRLFLLFDYLRFVTCLKLND